ncbi:MAG: hypothetical protein HYX46_06200 [Betaproteobacteria bacterium]|nr:hypothetical protein [Betaproteobacteria bacterium]
MRLSRLAVLALFLLLALALNIRLRASLGDLWLDEVWSLQLARRIHSAIEVFTGLHHDNNHHLATLLLYWMGTIDWWPAYRLPSVIAGAGTVFLAWWIGSRRNQIEGFTALAVTGASFLLIQYSSESRGYAWACFFALLAYTCLERYLLGRHLSAALAFGASVCLGFLSHLTFVHVYLAAVLWSLGVLIPGRKSWREVIGAAAQCHALPFAFLLVFYLVDIQHLQTGGATPRPLAEVLGQTLALAFGGPTSGPWFILAVMAPVVFFCFALRLSWRSANRAWIFLASSVVLSPLLFLFIHDTRFLQERYFLVPISILLLASSGVLADWYRRGVAGRLAFGALLGAYLVSNAVHVGNLLQHGRGHYLEAIQYMASHTGGNDITVGSDHHFRNATLLDFYSRYLAPPKRIRYLPAVSAGESPDWLIAHTQETDPSPMTSLRFPNGLEYALAATYLSAPLSGFTWFVYQRRFALSPNLADSEGQRSRQ